jgi:hypothetical protein
MTTMSSIALRTLLERTEKRKAALGLVDTAEATEALRNKGARRTPQKRELLQRAEERAKAADLKATTSYY